MKKMKYILFAVMCMGAFSSFAQATNSPVQQNTLVQNTLAQNLTAEQILQQLIHPAKDTSPTCPGGGNVCPGKTNCCSIPGGGYSCTGYSNGVCCPDGIHSCPPGNTCTDVKGVDICKPNSD